MNHCTKTGGARIEKNDLNMYKEMNTPSCEESVSIGNGRDAFLEIRYRANQNYFLSIKEVPVIKPSFFDSPAFISSTYCTGDGA